VIWVMKLKLSYGNQARKNHEAKFLIII
jgi:hypothetical protein